ncbi:MAG TPA: hypothetical protein VGH66_03965 [Acidimicrobiales bacterium]|jgi:hypothetical protein
MYPTVTDQLRELRRVLNDVVMPEVSGSYARDTLSTAMATLQMLEGAWDRVLPFLLWDNEQLTALVGELEPQSEPPDPSDFTAVHRRNLDLRDRLAGRIRDGQEVGPAPPIAALTAYFRARIARYPFASTVALPTRK